MSSSTTQKAGNYLTSMIIIGVLFFIFGFVTWLNGTLIPFLKLACELKTDTQAFFVTSAFYMAYFFLAIPSSGILQRTGFKNGMALGLLVMALGSLIFIPAANTRNFALFLTGLFVQGAGLSLLQTASNPYISIIGPIESAAQRISFMGICNKIAGALSPLILGAIVLKNASKLEQDVLTATSEVQKAALLDELAQRVIMPYTIMAIILVILAFWIRRSALPDVNMEADLEGDDKVATNKTSVFQFPHLLLGSLCIFMYVGAEVMAGDVIGTYGKNLGFSLDQAKYFTSFTLISMLIGYIIGIVAIPKYITQESSLKYAAILGVIFTIAAFLTKGQTSVTFIALLGLANAPMWPAIFPLGINKLGKFTKIGSAFMIMGIAGGAIIPLVYGEISKSLGFQMAFMVTMLPCYLYVLYYAMAGYRTK
ncbi:sugar MFS transporter [Haliscomenobacter hydrossis]|uniref:Glucose/galactose transporter n=1 Tax=Haliscomenobacter hydrossis (strain ATCC 27775 / DSM 1100 / LMG 10767 / O) TaxID=760192 RepID=F4KSG4_HALH1|nr:sugar MFS transporter [Haliscomenobacter hydrossis]AEE54315.1 glucose/galactose transporter [Haliscomenobacter hydrossis DSM 1100]